MRVLKRVLCFVISFLLIVSLNYVSFANEDNDTVKLGSFIIIGLLNNISEEEIPEWFRPYRENLNGYGQEQIEYIKNNELKVTKEQAKSITKLYTDDMVPLMYTSDEFGVIFSDFSGIEYLTNLERIGNGDEEYGISSYPFSQEQISKYYYTMVEHFKVEGADTIWPNLDKNTLRTGATFPYDLELQNYTKNKIEKEKKDIIRRIDESNISNDMKTELKNKIEEKTRDLEAKIKTVPAYDLSSPEYAFNSSEKMREKKFESEFEKIYIEEFDKVEEAVTTEELKNEKEQSISQEVENFRRTHETILSKDENTVSIEDESRVTQALEAYESLQNQESKDRLTNEKERLEKLKTKIEELKNAKEQSISQEVENFRRTHETILSKDENTVSIEDESRVTQALEAYESLQNQESKDRLTNEKEKLEKLKTKIEELKNAKEQSISQEVENFRRTHETILSKDENTVSIEDESRVTQALEAYESLQNQESKDRLTNEKEKLEKLKTKIEELKNAKEQSISQEVENFRRTHETILSKDENTVSIEDESRVTQALEAYESLQNQESKDRLTNEKEKLEKLKAKIELIKRDNEEVIIPNEATPSEATPSEATPSESSRVNYSGGSGGIHHSVKTENILDNNDALPIDKSDIFVSFNSKDSNILSDSIPKTGYSDNNILYFILSIVSVGFMLILYANKKNECKE